MKIQNIATVAIVALTLIGCSIHRKHIGVESEYESFESYLLDVVNDTTFMYVNELDIVDDKLYPILDTAIHTIENCDTYDQRIKYLYATAISPKLNSEDSTLYYSLISHNSIRDVFELRNVLGIFYYRNYLFLVYNPSKIEESLIDFCKINGCKLRVHLSNNFYRYNLYVDYLDFKKIDGDYIITNKRLCGPQVLIID